MTVKYNEERIEEIDKHANQSLINIADDRSDLECLLEITKAYKEAVAVIEFYAQKQNLTLKLSLLKPLKSGEKM